MIINNNKKNMQNMISAKNFLIAVIVWCIGASYIGAIPALLATGGAMGGVYFLTRMISAMKLFTFLLVWCIGAAYIGGGPALLAIAGMYWLLPSNSGKAKSRRADKAPVEVHHHHRTVVRHVEPPVVHRTVVRHVSKAAPAPVEVHYVDHGCTARRVDKPKKKKKEEEAPRNEWNAHQKALGGLGLTASEIRAAYYSQPCRHQNTKKVGNQHGKWTKCTDCGDKWERTESESCSHANTKNFGNQHGKWTKCLDCPHKWERV